MDLPEYGYPRKSLIQKNIDNDIIKIESIQDEIIPPNIRIAKILTQLDIKNTNKLNALTLKQNNNKYYANTKQITKYQYEELKKLQ